MLKTLICCAALFSATGLRADTFDFSFSGTGSVQGSGVITATPTLLGELVTGVSGTESYGGLFSPATLTGAVLYSPTSGELIFNTAVLFFSNNSYSEVGLPMSTGTLKIAAVSVPESATLLLLFSMGLGVWLLVRKLPRARRS